MAGSRRDLLRNRGLIRILARGVVSLTGSQMTGVALPVLVLDRLANDPA